MRLLVYGLILLLLVRCKEHSEPSEKPTNGTISYAKGFDISYDGSYTKLFLKKNAGTEDSESEEFLLLGKNEKMPDGVDPKQVIRIPVQKVVVTSTTHIPMMELLNEENTLIGFPNLTYISSERTRKRIAKGEVAELGNDDNLNTEILLELHPEVVMTIATPLANPQEKILKNAGIIVLPNGDWLEETPLGRAEWIKFFGALYNKDKEADSIFRAIESSYLEAKKIAQHALKKPTVLSGALTKEIWYLPAGQSYMAHFLQDAATDYLWADTTGKGSLSLSFENVFEKASQADLWIAPGHYKSMDELQEVNRHYAEFEPFKTKSVYSFATVTGDNGGSLFYERAPIQPHIVLKDLIKTAHPELLPGYQPFFLKPLD